ncbi:hypothetical protein CPB84DRAFT_1754263 [Gymnopilus junonius]|uniref:Uncharacterized protein n=1 Tax=Gymnopilus junonius TaxID=109634 RepID=A0A9P5N8R9_GYMJU|nr:hypothetical protein CPB84DRAFT_1754263 [Gymnopilus junonius]
MTIFGEAVGCPVGFLHHITPPWFIGNDIVVAERRGRYIAKPMKILCQQHDGEAKGGFLEIYRAIVFPQFLFNVSIRIRHWRGEFSQKTTLRARVSRESTQRKKVALSDVRISKKWATRLPDSERDFPLPNSLSFGPFSPYFVREVLNFVCYLDNVEKLPAVKSRLRVFGGSEAFFALSGGREMVEAGFATAELLQACLQHVVGPRPTQRVGQKRDEQGLLLNSSAGLRDVLQEPQHRDYSNRSTDYKDD